MPVDHYENFPVASILLPARFKEPVEAIYAFARSADDIADEGDLPAEQRLAGLEQYRQGLIAVERGLPVVGEHQGRPLAPLFERLYQTIQCHKLPMELLHALLDAFSQDVVKKRYADFDELTDYCRRSADPVGRLLLHLYDAATPHYLMLSDRICTSLQLINFWQDVAIDWEKQRIYLPTEDMKHFGVTEYHIAEHICDSHWQALLAFQVERARVMMCEGAPLAFRLPGRIGWELRLIVQGGLRILEKIEAAGYDVFRHRPVLTQTDWLRLLWRAAWARGRTDKRNRV